MANQEHLDILAKGVEAWNAWRAGNPAEPDLSGADLREYNLEGIDFANSRLSGVSLVNVDLVEAMLAFSNLEGADLSGANLSGARLYMSSLKRANLQHSFLNSSDLRESNLQWCNLSRARVIGTDLGHSTVAQADFDGAMLQGAMLCDLDLRDVLNLERVHHMGPSSIGLDTIYRSEGQIPESFLLGCGVPKNFITYMKSLTGAAFDFYSVFISHSTKDQPFADRLDADLQARGVRCWFAPHDIRGGRKIHEQIYEAIRVHDKLLLILSDASMNSEWVGEEIARACKRERGEGRRMLFPISIVPYDVVRDWECFDADAGKDSAREIREFFIPDFSNWKDHDSYQRAFDRLMRDLKANTATAAPKSPTDAL